MNTARNMLHFHRDRHSSLLNRIRDAKVTTGDVALLTAAPGSSAGVAPLSRPVGDGPLADRTMRRPLLRLLGETTIEQRRRPRVGPLWAGTPIEGVVSAVSIGSPEIVDLTEQLSSFDAVGWEWSRSRDALVAHVDTGGKRYQIAIPVARLRRIFNRCWSKQPGRPRRGAPFRATTMVGIFDEIGKFFEGAVNEIGRGVSNFVKDPGKWISDAGKDIGKVVDTVGKTIVDIGSSPVFAGIMTGLSAIPPLQAIGGAGLAAYAAANAAKPALAAVSGVAKAAAGMGGGGGKRKPLNAAQLAAARRIGAMNKSIINKWKGVPEGPQRNMLRAALNTLPPVKPTPKRPSPQMVKANKTILRMTGGLWSLFR